MTTGKFERARLADLRTQLRDDLELYLMLQQAQEGDVTDLPELIRIAHAALQHSAKAYREAGAGITPPSDRNTSSFDTGPSSLQASRLQAKVKAAGSAPDMSTEELMKLFDDEQKQDGVWQTMTARRCSATWKRSWGAQPEFLRTPQRGLNVACFKRGPLASTAAFTIGLSNVNPPPGAPPVELFLRVESEDRSWALAAGEIAAKLAGKCPFQPGDLVNFGTPISRTSAWSAFVIWTAEAFVPPLKLQRFPLVFRELLPLYREEYEFGLRTSGEALVEHFTREHAWNPRAGD